MAIQLARSYHVERGEPERWQVISPAQAYHGPTMQTLALTGRPGLQGPFGPYLPQHLHIPPSTWRFDPTGEAALEALDRALEEAGPENVSAFFCEADQRRGPARVHAATPVLGGPGRAPRAPRLPRVLRRGRDRRGPDGQLVRRRRHGLRRRTSSRRRRGSAPGYAAIGAVLCRDHVYQAVAEGSRRFTLGHTWDGAPLAVRGGARGAGGAAGRAADRAGPRTGTPAARRARRGPDGRPDGPRGPRRGLPARRVVRRPRDGTSFLPSRSCAWPDGSMPRRSSAG